MMKVIGNRKRNRSSSSALSTDWAKKLLDEKHHKGNAIANAYMIAKENVTFRREQAILDQGIWSKGRRKPN